MSEAAQPRSVKEAFLEIVHTLKAIVLAPRVIYGINIPYMLEGLVYFGILTVLGKFLHENVGLTDPQSGYVMGMLTGGITFAMFFLGGISDKIGIARSLAFAFMMMIVGRSLVALSSTLYGGGGMWSPMFLMVCAGLLFVVLAYGFYMPAAYAGVKKYTTKETATMGYAMLYALMNLGGFLVGPISPPLRHHFGMQGVFWFYVACTIVSLVVTIVLLTKKNEMKALEPHAEDAMKVHAAAEEAEGSYEKEKATFGTRILTWLKEHPLSDPKFTFFIFILIPVQTLFAHNWLTLPMYVDRAFAGSWVGANFEFFSNLNPIIIFIVTPLVAVFTAKANTYRMMILGTLVMAVPTFLLALGPSPVLFLTFILLMSLGEAMWQPRFLQWVAEIAPEGKTGAYIGIGQLPWFLTKFLTASYSGWFLAKYCPSEGALNTQTMWLIYALIACVSPVALFFAKGWIGKSVRSNAQIRREDAEAAAKA